MDHRTDRRLRLAAAVLAALAATLAASGGRGAEVTIDRAKRHQIILGWSGNPWAPWVTDWQRDRFLDEAVNELGLNRMRWGQPNGSRAGRPSWEPVNDNADPYDINWAAFATDTVDGDVKRWMLPFKKRLEALGYIE